MSNTDLRNFKAIPNLSRITGVLITTFAATLASILPVNAQQAEIKAREARQEHAVKTQSSENKAPTSDPILIIDSNKDGQPDGLTVANLKGLTPEEGNALMRLLLEEWTKGTVCEQGSGDIARFIRLVQDFFKLEHSGYNTNFNTKKSLGSVSVEGSCTVSEMTKILGGEMLNLKKITSERVNYYVLQQGDPKTLGDTKYTMFSEKQILDMMNRLREQQVL